MSLLEKFDLTSWYAAVIYVVGGLLVLVAAAEKLYGWSRWLKRKVRPDPPPPPSGPPQVTLGSISASTPLTHDEGAPHRRPAAIKPSYDIFNDNDYAIIDVSTGCRRSGASSGGQQFPWLRSHVRARSRERVDDVEIPPPMFGDVHESAAQKAFVFWVRFKDDRGEEWEAWRDAGTDQSDWLFHPEPLARPSLTARVVDAGTAKRSYRLELENDGDTPIVEVECTLPEDASNWSLLTEALHSYPIPVLQPGETQRIPLALGMGQVEVIATLRGIVHDLPYEREQKLSIF